MELRPYQQEDVAVLIEHPTYGIFNEQRTGKTPTSLVALDTKGCVKILIVCPASMVYKWKTEFERWLHRPCIALVGTPTQRDQLLQEWTDGMVVSLDTLKETKNRKGHIDQILKLKPDALILDEAHRIKNRKRDNFKSMRRLVRIPHRYLLTGTPAPNHASEVWSLLYMLDHKTYSSYWRFIDQYFYIDQVRVSKEVALMTHTEFIDKPGDFKSGAEEKLQKVLHQHSIMRKRKDVMPWLPKDPVPVRVRLPLTFTQNKQIEQLTEYFETEHVVTQTILDQLIRIRQVCLSPAILELRGGSPKIDWLLQYLKDYPERPTIVFSRMTRFLKQFKESGGDKVQLIVGETPKQQREQLVNHFQMGQIPILAIQIDAGKEGLTLDRAECIIFTDKYPPAGDYDQAKDRFVATTPEMVDVPKEIIELVMANSYDEMLFDMVDQRLTELDVINNYIKYIKEE